MRKPGRGYTSKAGLAHAVNVAAGGHGPGITIYLVDQEQWVPAHLACAGRYSLPNLIRTLRSATSFDAATTNRSTRGVDGEHHEPADRDGGAQQVEQLNGGHAWREGAAPRPAEPASAAAERSEPSTSSRLTGNPAVVSRLDRTAGCLSSCLPTGA